MDQVCANDIDRNPMQDKCYNYTTTRCTVEKHNVTKTVPKISVSIFCTPNQVNNLGNNYLFCNFQCNKKPKTICGKSLCPLKVSEPFCRTETKTVIMKQPYAR